MIRRIIVVLILSLMLTSCGGAAPTAVEEPAATEAPAATEPFAGELNTPTPEPPTETATPAPTNTTAATSTETPLPTLELPTEAINAPQLMVWDGTPTYPGDSTPGYSFRVSYDPDLWALTQDQFGFPALGHRNITNCVLSVTSGRGLPPTISVEHDILKTDIVTFDVGTGFENGVRKFVTYTGGDGNIITAFEVSFTEDSDACIADAVTVVSTLRSVPNSRATPTSTP
jgi:hypothetical protein